MGTVTWLDDRWVNVKGRATLLALCAGAIAAAAGAAPAEAAAAEADHAAGPPEAVSAPPAPAGAPAKGAAKGSIGCGNLTRAGDYYVGNWQTSAKVIIPPDDYGMGSARQFRWRWRDHRDDRVCFDAVKKVAWHEHWRHYGKDPLQHRTCVTFFYFPVSCGNWVVPRWQQVAPYWKLNYWHWLQT